MKASDACKIQVKDLGLMAISFPIIYYDVKRILLFPQNMSFVPIKGFIVIADNSL
jgi:hypothetical protein